MSRHRLAIVLVGLVLVLVGAGAWLLRVEDIPDVLPPVKGDPTAVTIPSLAGEPPLVLAELTGKTAFFVVVGAHTADSKEGQALNRALNRWIYPDSTVGYIVGDAEGFEVFRDRITQVLGHFAAELRFPLHVDLTGGFIDTFALPKGHHGFVVLGPDGSVLMRKSGGIEADGLAEVQAMLGAREPDPGPPAPVATVAGIDLADCTNGHACVLLFLGRDVARRDVPGLDDGFEGEDEELFRQMEDPAVRLVSTATKMELKPGQGVLVGRVRDIELPGWNVVAEAPEARAAFGLAPTDSALVVVADGLVAMREVGLVRMYEWGRVADLLGVEINDRKPPKGE